ncbi:LptA/OstA family protein [Candidatus Palibaumannia cicadellinicola]|uniref:LptA/OstA family protein n=1 Tax=Candidatus Palibaumannia cicadellinicola TaxID=186490 RepID=UPI002A4E1B84|nr:LptA/OstA family protein [Candidatus Baumannia cicadellinicola]
MTRPDGQEGREVVGEYANPIISYQLQKDGKRVRGHALKVRYETTYDLISFIDEAYLEHSSNNIKHQK